MNIVIQYDASAANAPAGFKQAVEAAVQFYDYLITNPITVPIVFSYGVIQGQAISSGAAAESSTNGNIETFSSVVSLLSAAATSATDLISIANLPTTDPTNGGKFWVSDAQARVFGLSSQPGYTDPEDGFVGISSRLNFSWDPTNRAAPGTYDAIGALEHEIAEVLGRYDYLAGSLTFNGYNLYAPLDLFRFTGTGTRTVAYSGGYFSIDGGKTLQLQFNNPRNGGDGGDWASSVVGDAYGGAFRGVASYVSPTDLQVMDVLGYQLAPLGNPVAGAAPVVTVTNGAPASIAESALTGLITNDYLGALSVVAASLDAAFVNAGTLTINAASQTVVFTPAAGFAGMATGTVSISDNNGGSVLQPITFMAAGSSVTNLGAGPQTVTLTSASQIINGGAGAATINATAATAGALLKGGSGGMTLFVTGGGSVTLNTGDSGLGAVNLQASSSPYAFTANSQAGLVINDNSSGADTITIGAASQTVNGGAGAVSVNATAATAGALLKGGAGGLTLKVSGGGSVTLNAGDSGVVAVNLQTSSTAYTFTAGAQTGLIINDNGGGADTITVGAASQTVNGAAGAASVNATAATAGALLKGGAGGMTLNITGGGIVTLNVGDSGLGAVNLQAASSNYAFTANAQAGLIINDNSSGADTITVGAASQTVNGGAGAATINATAATAGALLKGGAGGLTLNVTGGGAVTLNAGDSGLLAVNLQASSTAYAFTAGAQSGLVVNDNSSGADTVTAGGAKQTITGGGAGKLTMVAAAAGGDTFKNTAAAFNGDTIKGFATAGNVIDVTDLTASKLTATFVENAAGTAGQLNLSDGTHSASIALFGQFMAGGFSGTALAAGFTATSDGVTGTKITYAAPIPALVVNLGASPSTLTLVSANETVNGGAGAATINGTAATAGALLKGGSGGMTLNVSGGGVVTLNVGDSGLGAVNLQATSNPYAFTANAQAGLLITDKSTGADTVTAGGARQTITGGGAGKLTMVASTAGGDIFRNTAAQFNGDTIKGFASPGNIIDVTTLNPGLARATFVENAAGTSGQLTVSDGFHTAKITLLGQFMAAGFSGSAAAAGFAIASDGTGGANITYMPVLATPH